MADKVVAIKFEINSADAVEDINKVTKATDGVTAASSEYEEQLNDTKKATDSFKGSSKQFEDQLKSNSKATEAASLASNSFEEQLKEIKKTIDGANVDELEDAIKQYKNIAIIAGQTSPIGREAIMEASALKDKIEDLETAVSIAQRSGTQLQGALQLGSGIAAGYGAVQGVMALVGSESEDLQKTLVKLQAVQATLASVEEIRAVLQKESAFMITATTVAEKARAAATVVSTYVTNASSLALKGFKAALVATGIGAFIVVLGSVIAYWDELTQAIGLSTKSTADYTAALDKLAAKEQRRLNNKIELQKNELKLAELKGESDKQLFEREKKINDLELAARERQRITDQKLVDSYKQRRKEGQNFSDDEKQRFEELLKNENNYYSDIRKIEFEARIIEETFYQNEKKKAEERAKEAEQKRKEAEEKRKKEAEESFKKQIEEELNAWNFAKEGAEIRKKAADEAFKEQIEQELNAWNFARDSANAKKILKEEELAEEIRIRDAKIQIANDLQSTLTNLGNLIINDSAKAVKFNKAMALIQIGIDTATALSKALSVTQSPSPDNVATGGLAGVAKYAGIAAMIFANAAKAKQILSSGNAAGSPPTLGGGGGGSPTQMMQTQAPQTPGRVSNLTGSQTTTVKAIVVESDITTTQKRINSIQELAKI